MDIVKLIVSAIPGLTISRETADRLEAYQDILIKWQSKINLVGPDTLPDFWNRHILDSAQLLTAVPHKTKTIADMGSGAGFPGMVLAMLNPQLSVHLIESDVRKSIFLQEVSRVTKTPVTIHNERVEALEINPADVVTARALAPLRVLLDWSQHLMHKESQGIFLKGEKYQAEIEEAQQAWDFGYKITPSLSHSVGVIIHVSRVRKR